MKGLLIGPDGSRRKVHISSMDGDFIRTTFGTFYAKTRAWVVDPRFKLELLDV